MSLEQGEGHSRLCNPVLTLGFPIRTQKEFSSPKNKDRKEVRHRETCSQTTRKGSPCFENERYSLPRSFRPSQKNGKEGCSQSIVGVLTRSFSLKELRRRSVNQKEHLWITFWRLLLKVHSRLIETRPLKVNKICLWNHTWGRNLYVIHKNRLKKHRR